MDEVIPTRLWKIGLALAVLPRALLANDLADPNNEISLDEVHLLQLTIDIGQVDPVHFTNLTQTFSSCEDARTAASWIPAKTVELTLPLRRLPSLVQDMLEDVPTGRASPLFGVSPEEVRVLVVCNRNNSSGQPV